MPKQNGLTPVAAVLCGVAMLSLAGCATPKAAGKVPVTAAPSVATTTSAVPADTSAQPMPAAPALASLPPAAKDLRLVLRSTSEVTTAKQSNAALVAQPLVGDLWQVLALDSSPGLRFASASDLDQLKLSQSDAFALGQQNAVAGLPALVTVTHDLTPHQIGVIQGKDEETSRILAVKDWAALAHQLDGHLLVAVPASDTVLYCEENGTQSVRTFATTARDTAAKAAHAVSPALLRWTPNGWESVMVP